MRCCVRNHIFASRSYFSCADTRLDGALTETYSSEAEQAHAAAGVNGSPCVTVNELRARRAEYFLKIVS